MTAITYCMAKYCELFLTFFKVGAFTIGGGYAMIPLMKREVVERRGWMTEAEFLDSVSLSQAMPGVFAVNMATQVGYRLRGVGGSAVSIAGNVLVPIAVILLVAVFFPPVQGNSCGRACLHGAAACGGGADSGAGVHAGAVGGHHLAHLLDTAVVGGTDMAAGSESRTGGACGGSGRFRVC